LLQVVSDDAVNEDIRQLVLELSSQVENADVLLNASLAVAVILPTIGSVAMNTPDASAVTVPR